MFQKKKNSLSKANKFTVIGNILNKVINPYSNFDNASTH